MLGYLLSKEYEDYEKEEEYSDGLSDGLSEKKPLRHKYESIPGHVDTKVYVAPSEKDDAKS